MAELKESPIIVTLPLHETFSMKFFQGGEVIQFQRLRFKLCFKGRQERTGKEGRAMDGGGGGHLFYFIFFSQMLINAMCCICLSGDPRDQGTSLLGNPLNTTNNNMN